MPGGPTGRGCDACRVQKKKVGRWSRCHGACDQLQPACTRCARLHIDCVGAGQQRYRFVQQRAAVIPIRADSTDLNVATDINYPDWQSLIYAPIDRTSALRSSLINAIAPTTDQRFNLTWAFGGFISLVPERLGRSEALDACVLALTNAHTDVCLRRKASLLTTSSYGQALRKLRETLNDPESARTANVLCAVMLLLVTQTFMGATEYHSSYSHVAGMAQILKQRGSQYDHNDPFESMLLASLRGPVAFSALYKPDIELTDSQWRNLAQNSIDDYQRPEGFMMQAMGKAPLLVMRGRTVLRGQASDPTLVQEIDCIYQKLLRDSITLDADLKLVQKRVKEIHHPQMSLLLQGQDALMRLVPLQLAMVALFGCILGAITEINSALQEQLNACAERIYSYVALTEKLRPLGAMYLLLSLQMAWTVTSDQDLRRLLQEAYHDREADFAPSRSIMDVVRCLGDGAKKLSTLGA